MRVTRVAISNILGIEDLTFEPGSVTVVEGGNGVGKTSILSAIRAGLGGGQDATLLRQGAKEGRIVLILEDGTEITKRVSDGGKASLTVKHPQFGAIAKPQSFLDKLADALAVNPVEFLAAPAKKRAEWLLEVLPCAVTDEQLLAAGVCEPPPASANGLGRIDAARQAAYDERTGVNRTAKEKKATIAQLEAALPAAPAGEPRAVAQNAETDLEDVRAALAGAIEKVRLDEDASTKAINTEVDAAIRKAEAERTEKLAAARERARQAHAATMAELQPKVDAATARAAETRTHLERAAADTRSRQFIEEHREAVAALEENSERLSQVLASLDALRTSALENLPIKGVEVKDGEVLVDGIPFDRVNKAKQIRVALNVARLRSGQLGLVCVDGLEALDQETFVAFEKAAEKSGLQFVVNRVTSGPLKVNTQPLAPEAKAEVGW